MPAHSAHLSWDPAGAHVLISWGTGLDAPPDRSASSSPSLTPVPVTQNVAVWSVNVGTGAHDVLYDGPGPYYLSNAFYPDLVPARDAIWISTSSTEGATRYALDGTALATIPGAAGVVESRDAQSRAYYRRSDGTLVVARGDVRRVLAGRNALPTFSPSGDRVAYYAVDRVTNAGALTVLEIATGVQTVVATNVDPCQCDGSAPPSWSSSGRFIAYHDYGGQPGGDAGGEYLVAAAGGPPARLTAPPVWLSGDRFAFLGGGDVVTMDAATGAVQVLASGLAQQGDLRLDETGRLLLAPGAGAVDGSVGETVALDAATGAIVGRGRWPGAIVTWTPVGLAAVATSWDGTLPPPCSSGYIDHPLLTQPRCLGSHVVRWSPDGMRLAYVTDASVHVLDLATGDDRVLVDTDTSPSTLRWSADGSRLVVAWGGGL